MIIITGIQIINHKKVNIVSLNFNPGSRLKSTVSRFGPGNFG
jgi:hypothetical protein